MREAWRLERALVLETGQGTRNWTKSEIKELLSRGKVAGFFGHHIKSVKAHPKVAGDPDNIMFVTRGEHLKLHFGNWRNSTSGNPIKR